MMSPPKTAGRLLSCNDNPSFLSLYSSWFQFFSMDNPYTQVDSSSLQLQSWVVYIRYNPYPVSSCCWMAHSFHDAIRGRFWALHWFKDTYWMLIIRYYILYYYITILHTILLYYYITILLAIFLYYYITILHTILLYYYITYYNTILLYYYITYYNTILLYCYITILLYYYIAISLYYYITILLYYTMVNLWIVDEKEIDLFKKYSSLLIIIVYL